MRRVAEEKAAEREQELIEKAYREMDRDQLVWNITLVVLSVIGLLIIGGRTYFAYGPTMILTGIVLSLLWLGMVFAVWTRTRD